MSDAKERLSDVIIVNGPPGSGKGFLSNLYVEENPHTQHIAAGQQVRGIRSGDIESVYASTVLAHLESKSYLPDETFGDIILEEMTRYPNFIDLTLVDGFPHNLGDLDYVQEKLNESGRRILGAVCLDATVDTCVARMSYRGMREGEYVRKSAIFAATESEREYYGDRYLYYLDTKDALVGMLMDRGLQIEPVDANPDILGEEGLRIVVSQFKHGILSIRANNMREEQ